MQQPRTRPAGPRARISPTRAGLDGVRAFAVAAVVVFHIRATVAAGRFPRRRRVLRAVGFPDHVDPADRVPQPEADRHQELLPAPRTAAAARAVHDARRGHAAHVAVRARRAAPAARRRGRGTDVLHELDADLLGPFVLRPARPSVAVAASLVAGGRGAVLRAVAADPGRVPRRDPAPVARARRAGRAHRAVARADGLDVPRRAGHRPHLLRHRHAHRADADRRDRRDRRGVAPAGRRRPRHAARTGRRRRASRSSGSWASPGRSSRSAATTRACSAAATCSSASRPPQ